MNLVNNKNFINSPLDWIIFSSFLIFIFLFISNFEYSLLPSGQQTYNYYIIDRGFVFAHEYIKFGIKFGAFCYAIYFSISLFIRWIIAWKPLPVIVVYISKILMLILVNYCTFLTYHSFYKNKRFYFYEGGEIFLLDSIHDIHMILELFSASITIVFISFLVFTYKKNRNRI